MSKATDTTLSPQRNSRRHSPSSVDVLAAMKVFGRGHILSKCIRDAIIYDPKDVAVMKVRDLWSVFNDITLEQISFCIEAMIDDQEFAELCEKLFSVTNHEAGRRS